LGTLITMAPEVYLRKPYGLKADIWSIGMILFQMVFGVIPFKAKTQEKLIE
jgi:serine/threonine protein kinase